MASLWVYLHFPALQLDSLFQSLHQPAPLEGAQPPLAAPASTPAPTPTSPALCLLDPGSFLIKQLNTAARQQGIQAGMTLSMASALCHDLQVLPYQAAQELQYLQQIAALLYQISADIALDPPCAVWLRIDPMLALYGGLAAYLGTLSQHITALQLQTQIAVAHSAAAAQLLCFSQPGFVSDDPALIAAALDHCSLHHSQLQSTATGQKILQQLQAMGINNLGQLLAIPRPELSRRFSTEVIMMLDQVAGDRPTVSQFYQPPEQFCQSLELLYQLEHTQQMQAPLGYLLQLLQNYLQLRDQHCYQLQLRLELRDHPPLLLNLQSACGEYQQARWLTLFQLKLQQLKLPAPLLKMQLSAGQTTARDGDNLPLFDSRPRDGAEAVNQQSTPASTATTVLTADALRLRSLLTAKLGAERVQQPSLHADHRPELANSYHQTELLMVAGKGDGHYRANRPPHRPSLSLLPLRPGLLLIQPIPLRMQLQLQPGLERITTGWWDQKPIQRDYYIGRNEDGQWCWAFKNASGWYLQGYFA
ncbi:DNA polymerase Y family protein [Rheinheimera riviphila]|uniref:DNA polymerase Y family protein n=1 Tax=Rheinheimera riviphila TaxID=1834037 RepID=A0A437QM56_9GAMM|nr:DNA polymerase Y family protein [Rheinheimera riviphila]RVU35608.1 DNA polymerase Y family protein [Rheinheimera riviphila]